MLIGVISDTHIKDRASEIPEAVFRVFEGVDMVLHAGDLIDTTVKDTLNKIAPTYCVQGNMDRHYGLKLPKNRVMEIEGVELGLNHGEVYPRGDTQQLKYLAMEMDVKVLITGHTHQAFVKQIGDILLLNPGSPTVPRLTDPTVMLLNINNGNIDSQIVKIGDPLCKALNFSGP
ncbi:metallophosphoesterase [Methanobacterium alcaliphilum]|uniref:metallophosphoesterase n=1 Tax=Methanobacterium alcaliphilum TaxID=392018 RepID=UPI00200A0F11|nr:metallophosphoesterase [Methanobacterium alcaliphilum]MCK9152291.1 metallophosphoesterase [Methanobacterium alcaliphilum]